MSYNITKLNEGGIGTAEQNDTELIELIDSWDWPDTEDVPDGWYITTKPFVTRDNLEFLADKFNELADAVNKMVSK